MKTAPTVEKRAVEIAAVVMVRAGLCRFDSLIKCKKGYVDEHACRRCIKSWLISKAKRELAEGRERRKKANDSKKSGGGM